MSGERAVPPRRRDKMSGECRKVSGDRGIPRQRCGVPRLFEEVEDGECGVQSIAVDR